MNIFISTVRYDKTLDNDLVKTVNEQYLIDAISFTEAEARTIKEIAPFMMGDFTIPQIVKPRIREIHLNSVSDADSFYKVKFDFITLDERSGKEKRSSSTHIVQAKDFDSAHKYFLQMMQGTMMDYEITSIVKTGIIDYFPYKHSENGDTERTAGESE